MIKYIFLLVFFAMFIISFFKLRDNKLPSLVMFLGYVLYICFILPLVNNIIYPVSPVDADRLYYLLLTVLNTSIGFVMLVINKKYKNKTSKYIACLSFCRCIKSHLR